jgi:hypothetical protein
MVARRAVDRRLIFLQPIPAQSNPGGGWSATEVIARAEACRLASSVCPSCCTRVSVPCSFAVLKACKGSLREGSAMREGAESRLRGGGTCLLQVGAQRYEYVQPAE